MGRNQMQSDAIICNQMQSGAITHLREWTGHRIGWVAIRCNRMQSDAIRCNQVQSGAITHLGEDREPQNWIGGGGPKLGVKLGVKIITLGGAGGPRNGF